MSELQQLSASLLALWIVVVGFAFMVRGPRGAWAVVAWPFRMSILLVRRTVGGILIGLGNWVRGRPQQRDDRRRH